MIPSCLKDAQERQEASDSLILPIMAEPSAWLSGVVEIIRSHGLRNKGQFNNDHHITYDMVTIS